MDHDGRKCQERQKNDDTALLAPGVDIANRPWIALELFGIGHLLVHATVGIEVYPNVSALDFFRFEKLPFQFQRHGFRERPLMPFLVRIHTEGITHLPVANPNKIQLVGFSG